MNISKRYEVQEQPRIGDRWAVVDLKTGRTVYRTANKDIARIMARKENAGR